MHRVTEEIIINNSWRDGEFAKFKANSLRVEEKLWCRMCIPMIYAHWEGFVVDAFKILLKHLNSLQLDSSQIPTNLVVVSLDDSFKSLSGKQNFDQRVTFTDKFQNVLKQKVNFTPKINTKSNLKSNVLEDICDKFGFDFAKFNDVKRDLDQLVHIRNSIAHGENSFLPNTEKINNLIESVKNGIDILIAEIDTYVEEELYLLQTESLVEETL